MPNLVDKLKPISDKPDDLFICAAGPEGTCLDSMLNAHFWENKFYSSRLAVILAYGILGKESDPMKVYNMDKQDASLNIPPYEYSDYYSANNFTQLSHRMNFLFPNRVKKINFSRSNPHTNYYNLKEVLQEDLSIDNLANITIDATSILDQDLFSILHLVDKPDTNVRVLYSKPPKGKLPWSKGYVFTSVLPGFQGDLNQSGTYNHVAAILCGYDPQKARVLDDMLRSSYTYFIFPKPSFHKGWDSMSKRLHKRFVIVQGDSKILDASGLDPLSVKSVLDNIYNTHKINHEDRSLRYYMQVALAGCTKLQTVGAYLFVRDKVKEKDGLSYSPIGVYYAVSAIPSVIKGPGELVEFMLPKKNQ